MRYLNKIVFINSAHIRYEEVMLDGNVHFIGTQGVGKSTILRALLFFYNAKKTQLGIQPGQKSFDEFYFEKSNSYIVYEVMRETGAYTILVDRFQGKATFFFIDAPYNRNWIVEDNGNVISEWMTIRNRIGKGIDVTGRIDTYEMYLNIIFGNTHDIKHRFEKFAIAESSKFQNIPKSIQNVFLNSKLEAEFVRDTIIQSVEEDSGEKKGINLASYRHQLESFENEYNDISLWFEQDREGNYPLRQQADRVVETYRQIVAFDREMKSLWRKLNFALQDAKRQIPKLESNKLSLEEKIDKLKTQLKDFEDKYEYERGKLNRDLGAIDSKLKEISVKRRFYEQLNISEVLALASQEKSFIVEKNRLETIKNSLLKEYDDITEKYKVLFDELERSRKDYEQSKRQILTDKREEMVNALSEIALEEKKLLKEIDDKYDLLLKESDERLNNIYNEKSRCEGLLRDLKTWHPKENEIKNCSDEILKIKNSEAELEAKQKSVISEIERLRAEAEKEHAEKENEYKTRKVKNQFTLDEYVTELGKVEALLGNYEGSFYQWLEVNKPGWQENIGKIVDENNVLYATGLNPVLSNTSDKSLFGVDIDLNSISDSLRTPDEYKSVREELRDKIDSLKKNMLADKIDCEKSVADISRRFSAKTYELRQTKTELEIQKNQLPQKLRSLETQLYRLGQEEKSIVDNEREARQRLLDEVVLKLQKEAEVREKMNASKQREQKSINKEIASKGAGVKNDYESLKQCIEKELADNLKNVEEQRLSYEAERQNVLRGRGVDTSILAKNQKEIDSVSAKLKTISEQASLVYDYRKDERELFNNEESFRLEKKTLEAKIDIIKQKYQDSRQKKEQEYENSRTELSETALGIKKLYEGINEAEQYCQTECDLPMSLLSDVKEIETKASCRELIVSLRGCINKKRGKREDLKKAITQFICRFSAENVFNFKLDSQSDEGYNAFSLNLQEFLDSNKIEQYRHRTNEHYADILLNIARDVGYVMQGTSKIKDIISAVNRDFRERNFAGVIKSIELRPEDSSDKLMQILLSIKTFADENLYTMGEVNLFTGDNRNEVSAKVVELFVKLMKLLQKESSRQFIGVADSFRLQFRVRENDNDTNWVERISNVGSDGTDILVKAMINIMLINVFKERASRKFGDFKLHCMMDEIGKLHPNNIKGILQFANSRNILLVNSSPTTNNPYDYKYTYTLSKDANAQTRIMLTLKKEETHEHI